MVNRLAEDLWAARILDSTTLPRERRPSRTSRGTMTFLTDGEGRAIG